MSRLEARLRKLEGAIAASPTGPWCRDCGGWHCPSLLEFIKECDLGGKPACACCPRCRWLRELYAKMEEWTDPSISATTE